MKTSVKVTVLNLDGNDIGNAGLTQISEALKSNTSLKYLPPPPPLPLHLPLPLAHPLPFPSLPFILSTIHVLYIQSFCWVSGCLTCG